MLRAMAVFGVMFVGFAVILTPSGCAQQAAQPFPRRSPTPDVPSSSRPKTEPEKSELIVKAAGRVRWSLKCGPEAVRRLRSGDRRLVLSLHAYDPPKSGNSTFVVSLISTDGKVRRIVDHFAPFPNQPFEASAKREPQRFQFDLSNDLDLLDDSRLTVEVGFDPNRGSADGGRAVFSARLADVD